MCSRCKRQYEKGFPFDPGISGIKKDYCENLTGMLGFPCPHKGEKLGSHQTRQRPAP